MSALTWVDPLGDAEGAEAWEKMVSSELYSCESPYLVNFRAEARRLSNHYNTVLGVKKDMVQRAVQLGQLFGTVGTNVIIEAPLRVDYGKNIHVGANFYANFDCVFLDWYVSSRIPIVINLLTINSVVASILRMTCY